MDEQVVIRRILEGDKQAYNIIIERYKNPLFATILRMTNDVTLAQDLVQEVLIKVYEQLPKYQPTGTFKSWLYRVAINYCMDVFRKQKNEMIQEDMDILQEQATPEIIYLKQEKHRAVEAMLATLPEQERLIICLRYRNELSYDEIAHQLATSISDVRNKLHRAKKKLRHHVKEGGYFDDMSKRTTTRRLL